ncbi:Uncharacterized protein TCM_029869 [Theobroma cacao]|uniref:Uncharacterized protein n=1 Tax=Theobroma cacao TaxID=3641 RepID=A0A061GFR2_THECC|nr:Uncharacterized protein TCM_029869 [Theobroma cacao]
MDQTVVSMEQHEPVPVPIAWAFADCQHKVQIAGYPNAAVRFLPRLSSQGWEARAEIRTFPGPRVIRDSNFRLLTRTIWQQLRFIPAIAG